MFDQNFTKNLSTGEKRFELLLSGLEADVLPITPFSQSGGDGIRTHGPSRASGFQDRRTRPDYATPPKQD